MGRDEHTGGRVDPAPSLKNLESIIGVRGMSEMKTNSSILRIGLAILSLLAVSSARVTHAQDNIMIYGNSIISGGVKNYFIETVEQAGIPTPNVVASINGNAVTSSYVSSIGLISNSLPAGQTWKAMIVQGGTIETTTNFGNPQNFHNNMLTLGSAFLAHSPGGIFIGHETGADHPNSSRYPAWYPDPASWLLFPQLAYARAGTAITNMHPGSPPTQIAKQGTVFANTAGYDLTLFQGDLHHHTKRGKVITACLYYIEIYGGKACDIPIDFSVATPLVTHLMNDGIDQATWDKLASIADRSQPRAARDLPGSDDDFQMRTVVNGTVTNMCPTQSAAVGDFLTLELLSPLGATDNDSAGVYVEFLPTGMVPTTGGTRGLQLNRNTMGVLWSVPNLTNAVTTRGIPQGLSGSTMWLQGFSAATSSTPGFTATLSDAQRIEIQ